MAGTRTDISLIGLLIERNVGVPGNEGWEIDWSSSLGFTVDFSPVPILLVHYVRNRLYDNSVREMIVATRLFHM